MTRFITVSPQQYYDYIVLGFKSGLIDRWEAWKQLYNAGWRGKDLAPLYKVSK